MKSDADRRVVGVIMGVAGVGKTAVGREAAERLGWDFVDGDDYHPEANVGKMSRGIALTDEDRRAWLETLQDLIHRRLEDRRPAIVACSALKASYRKTLTDHNDGVVIIYLKAGHDVVRDRIQQRTGHFFNATLLRSQFDALEEPDSGITIDATQPIPAVVTAVVNALIPDSH